MCIGDCRLNFFRFVYFFFYCFGFFRMYVRQFFFDSFFYFVQNIYDVNVNLSKFVNKFGFLFVQIQQFVGFGCDDFFYVFVVFFQVFFEEFWCFVQMVLFDCVYYGYNLVIVFVFFCYIVWIIKFFVCYIVYVQCFVWMFLIWFLLFLQQRNVFYEFFFVKYCVVYGDMYFMMNFGVIFVEFVLVFFVLGNYV